MRGVVSAPMILQGRSSLGYNYPMPVRRALQQGLLLLLIVLLLVAPGWLAGEHDIRRARYLAANGQGRAAALTYAAAARRFFWQPELWEQAGLAALAGDDPALASHYLERAQAHGALSSLGWLAWGDAHYRLGEGEQAQSAWEQALPEKEAYRRLARLARQQGDLPQAIACWEQLLKDQAEDAEANYTLGLLLTATSPDRALPYLVRAAQLDTNLEEAVHTIRTSLNRAGSEPASRFFQGGLGLAAVQAWDLAEEAFRRTTMLQPAHAEAWAWLAETLQQQGQDGTAALQEALRLDPGSATVQALYGLHLQRQGQIQQAISAFQNATALQPAEAAWWAALAGAYEQEGELVGALAGYQKAAQQAPQNALYWRTLIEFCLRHQIHIQDVALPATRTLFALAPEAWYAHDLLGQVLLAMGDLPGAYAAFQKALELAPQQVELYLHLGEYYLQSGHISAACNAFQRGREVNPAAWSWQAERLWEQYCSPRLSP